MTIRLNHIELFCRDTAAAARWWQDAMGAVLVADQGAFQWVEVGGFELLLRPGEPGSSPSYRSADSALVFATSDVAGVAETLRSRGVEFGHGDEDDCLTLQDSEGHWIQITDKA